MPIDPRTPPSADPAQRLADTVADLTRRVSAIERSPDVMTIVGDQVFRPGQSRAAMVIDGTGRVYFRTATGVYKHLDIT